MVTTAIPTAMTIRVLRCGPFAFAIVPQSPAQDTNHAMGGIHVYWSPPGLGLFIACASQGYEIGVYPFNRWAVGWQNTP